MTKLIGIAPKGDEVQNRTVALADDLTTELGIWVRSKIPLLMSDMEFAATSAALMIALNRKLAECAVAFGETHGIDDTEIGGLVFQQFSQNHRRALQAAKATATIQ